MNPTRKKLLCKIIVSAIFIAASAIIFASCKTNYSLVFLQINNRKADDFDVFIHHAETFKKAKSVNVRGDFEQHNSFEYSGIKAEMWRENDDYFVKFVNGENTEVYKIASVVGENRVEEYVAEKDGEFVRLPIGYDLKTQSWTSLNAAYFEPDSADFFVHRKDWRTDCAVCHLEKNNSAEIVGTTVFLTADFKSQLNASNVLQNMSSDDSLLACGQCHAKDLTDSMPKFDEVSAADFSPAKVISAHQKSTQTASHFYNNGAIRLTAHEYQGVIRSVCYLQSKADGTKLGGEKINCLSCHTAQNGVFDVAKDEKLHTNQICTTCHQQFVDASNLTEHTKHRADSAAGNCVSCHQPEIVYGNFAFQRTHEISVPDPQLTVNKQVPNACNVCHADKSVNWAITQTKNLWSERFRDAKISTDSQFDEAEGIRGLFAGDAFTRALSANNLAQHSDFNWARPFLLEAATDENYPLVRYFLAQSLTRENSPAPDFFASKDDAKQFAAEQLNELSFQTKIETQKISRRLRRLRRFPDIEIGE